MSQIISQSVHSFHSQYSRMNPLKAKIVEVVNLIPEGKVTNYGEVARVVSVLMGKSYTAQLI